jgi:hypothetical protein
MRPRREQRMGYNRAMNRLPHCVSIALIGCSAAGADVKLDRLSDGTFKLRCPSSLAFCVKKAEDICKDRGFLLLGGASRHTRYGHPGGESQVETRSGELVVKCARPDFELPAPRDAASAAPVPEDARTKVPVGQSVSSERSARACTPGKAERCVGPGACAGGQACLADGSGFGPCDCGNAQAP